MPHFVTIAQREADCLMAIGGGKCLDAGQAIAYRLSVPVVICRPIASNDAPSTQTLAPSLADGSI